MSVGAQPMRATTMKNTISKTQLFLGLAIAFALMLTPAAYAAAPGITGPTFKLTAQSAYITQPDGQAVYSWGYGCTSPTGIPFAPTTTTPPFCNGMQVPGPTLIVNEGDTVSVTLTNQRPAAAGNTSILV